MISNLTKDISNIIFNIIFQLYIKGEQANKMRIQKKNIKIILIIIVAFFVISIFYGLGQYRTSQRKQIYLAEVNGVGITYDQWQSAFQSMISRYDNQTLASLDQATINMLKNTVLRQIINSQLLLQQAKNEKVKISTSDIDGEIEKIKANFSSSEAFNDALKANNLTLADLKKEIENNLMINYILNQEKNKVSISEEELSNYYNENKMTFFDPEKVRARHILVTTEEEANEILLQLKEGLISFADLAKEKSICPSAANGGDLGFFSKGQMVKEFEEAAFSLKPGEISNIVKTEYGYHIIKCEEKKEAHSPTFEEVKENIEKILRTQKENELISALLTQLNEQANITINYDFASENISSNPSSTEEEPASTPLQGEEQPEELKDNQ